MTDHSLERSPQAYARTAGLLYLVIIVCGIFGEAVVRSSLVVPGDAAATAGNVLASEGLFRIGFAADTVMALCDVALAILLYGLLRPVNHTLALMATAFRLIQTAILGMNLMNHHAALLILNGAGSLAAFDTNQLNALMLLSLDTHRHGYDLGLVFFGLGSVVLGYLVFKARYLPRLLGILMGAAGLVYLTGSSLLFLAPALSAPFAPLYAVPLVAETAFCLWLLVKGIDLGQWRAANAITARYSS